MNFFRNTLLSIIAGAVCIATAGGCSYSRAEQRSQALFAQGSYVKSADALETARPPSRNQLLYLLELGTSYRAAGLFSESNNTLLDAVEVARDYDERAVISLRDTASFAAALAINDNLLPYRGAPYERVLLHTQLAMNFLLLHQLDDARVEIVRAYEIQREMREQHEEQIKKTKEEATKRSWDTARITAEIDRTYADQKSFLASAGNIYQNAFTYYLSSIVYEMNGEISDAYMDAKTVYSLNPNFLPVRTDLLRYSKQLGLRDDYNSWLEKFGEGAVSPTLPQGYGELIVLHECGLAPVKRQVKLILPIPMGTPVNRLSLITIAFPKFVHRYNPVATARVVEGGTEVGTTQPIMSVEATAVSDLWQRAPAIAIRHLIRTTGKTVFIEQMRHQFNGLGFLLAFLATEVTEQADLRSWQNLPRDYQVMRVALPAGTHDFNLELMTSLGVPEAAIPINGVIVPDGGKAFVVLRSTGLRGTAYQVTFGRARGDQ